MHFPFQIHTSGAVTKTVKRTFARVHHSPQGEMDSTLYSVRLLIAFAYMFLKIHIKQSHPHRSVVARSSVRPSSYSLLLFLDTHSLLTPVCASYLSASLSLLRSPC